MQRTHRTVNVLAVFALLSFAALGAPAAEAQSRRDCGRGWSEPVVCDVYLVASVRGENPRSRVSGDELRLRPDTVTILSVRPTDQFDGGFPAERFAYEIVVGRSCGGLLDVDEERIGEIRIVTGRRAGSCELAILPANNLNLDRRLTLTVSGVTESALEAPAPAAVSGEPEIIAGWLYRAILGREGEPSGIRAAAAEIAQGRIDEQVDRMLDSPEFAARRQGMSAAHLLDAFYQGLLGRAPDPAGNRRYRDEMIRGEYGEVIEDILGSDEFRARLGRATAERRR